MRLLAGTGSGSGAAALDSTALDADTPAWTGVEAGPWLAEVLADLRDPNGSASDPVKALHGTLRPYQRDGVAWLRLLARFGLGGCLADDMGLGKTVQVIALMLLLKRDGSSGPHLLVLPASLLGNWQSELARFAHP